MVSANVSRFNSLRLRLIAGAAVWTVLGLIAGGFLLSSLFRASVERSFDERLMGDLEIVIAATEPLADADLEVQRENIDPRYDNAFSGWYWQVRDNAEAESAGRAIPIKTSQSLWDQTLAIPNVSTADGARVGDTSGPEGQELRFIERDISFPSSAPAGSSGEVKPHFYRIAVAGDRAGIEKEITSFNTTLLWSLAALGIGLVIAVLIQVRVALVPLAQIGERLSAIRSGRAQKLEGEFPAEIAPLAGELNALLAHDAEVVARARTHVGNLAHFLKTPLSVLANEANAHPGPLSESVMRQTQVMRRHVDHYLARARAAAAADVIGSRTEVTSVAADLARTLEKIHDRRGIEIELDIPSHLAFRGERQDLEELMGNLVDNACKWARTAVKVSARRTEAGRLEITVEDDGRGLTPDERARVIEKRERLDENVPGSGLGLAIVRDISRLYGGDVSLEDSALGGLKAVLTLPAAEI